MPVDVYQLPIPDWGLSCPHCGYPLKSLPSHRCPECGTELDMASIVPSWARLRDPRFTGRELPFPDFGLDCEHCGGPLAGAAERACSICGQPFDPRTMLPVEAWFVVEPDLGKPLPMALVESILTAEDVPHLVREGLSAFGTGYRTLLVPREFYFELLWLIQDARRRIEAERQAPSGRSWCCRNCGAENPAGFERCWNCSE